MLADRLLTYGNLGKESAHECQSGFCRRLLFQMRIDQMLTVDMLTPECRKQASKKINANLMPFNDLFLNT